MTTYEPEKNKIGQLDQKKKKKDYLCSHVIVT